MKHQVLDRYQREYGPLAMRMKEGAVACAPGRLQLEGRSRVVPAIVVKGLLGALPEQPIVCFQVLGVETSQGPVLAVGVEFPGQSNSLAGWRWTWIPMHTRDQRALLEILGTTSAWLVVIFSGEAASRALIVRAPADVRERCRQIKRKVDLYPTNPGADADRAIEAARMATLYPAGDGYLLQIVRDIRRGGDPEVREPSIKWVVGPNPTHLPTFVA